MTDNPAKYFDDILRFLSTDYNRIFTFTDVLNYLYRHKRAGKPAPDGIFTVKIEPEENLNFLNAIMFLKSEGLVTYELEKAEIIIQTAGFIKIKTSGFENDIIQAQKTVRYQRFNWIWSPVLALLSLILSIVVLVSDYNKHDDEYIKCACRKENAQKP